MALLTAGTSATEHSDARQTVPTGAASPGTGRMQRRPCFHPGGALGPTITRETGACRQWKPLSKTAGGAPSLAEWA